MRNYEGFIFNVRKYLFSQMMINEQNKVSTEHMLEVCDTF